MSKKKSKRYWFNVVEEMVMNPDYAGFRGGRIEVFDRQSGSSYAVYEGRFWLPEELTEEFIKVFDWKDTDKLPYLRFDMKEEK